MDSLIDKAVINRDDFIFRWKGGAGEELHLGFETRFGVSLDRLYKETESIFNPGNQE